MRLAPTFSATFISLLSFSTFLPTAARPDGSHGNMIRVPLERKSVITLPPSSSVATRANSAVGLVNTEFLKMHVAGITGKYRNAFAAYESNMGTPHPLSQLIPGSGTAMSLPVGKMKKRRRSKDAASDNLIHDPRGRLTKRDDIALSEKNSNMWVGPISVGTPPQNYIVDFDTGSSDLILPCQNCDSTCNGHTRYDPTNSSSSVNLDKTFQMSYLGGAVVNGTQYADNVYMGGHEAINQTFGAASTYSSALESPTFLADGLLGMAFPEMSIMNTSPVFQTMLSNGVLPQGVFGFALSSTAGKSELTIGGTNTNMYQASTIEYVPVSLAGFWQIRLAGVSRPGVNGTADVVVVNQTSYAEAVVDTGTTLIVTSDSLAQAYYANVTGAKPCASIGGGTWSVPCDIIDSVAPTLTFGSRTFTVSPSTFNLGQVSEGSTDCLAGLAGGGSAWWIIGDVFLQNVYSVFDVTNNRVGFADLA